MKINLTDNLGMAVEWHNISSSLACRRIGVDRTGIGSGGPDDGSCEIHVQFLRGETYVYRVPDIAYWDNFLNANSHGRYYVEVLKARFDYCSKY